MGSAPEQVAVVVPSLTRAGAERVAETLAREFARRSSVTLVTMEPRLSSSDLLALSALPWAERIPPGCRQVHLPSTGTGLSRLVPLVFRFAVLARRERFDVVYSFLTWTNVLVAVARFLGGRYVHVASEHALAQSLRSDGSRFAALARALPLVYRFPDWIVVVSEAVRSSLLAGGVLPRPTRAVTIPNPIDTGELERLAECPPEVPLPAPRGPVLVCVARLHVQKDHATLLRAMTRLPVDCSLLLVGDGPLRAELEGSVQALGLEGRVTFTGMVENPYPLMRRAHVLVLASREEGFGMVAAEAAALGVPFVGSDVGGLGEVCRLLGHRTFPAGDDKALAEAIQEQLTSSAQESGGPESVRRLFGSAEVASRYLELASRPSP